VLAPVVTPEFVADHLGSLMLVDLRWYLDGRSGYDAYLAGHLPGAVFIDLAEIASDPGPAVGRHPLPSAEQFAAVMARRGISVDSETVVYDDQGGVIAARLVWMLRALGCSSALLDGGIGAWRGALERSEVTPPPAAFRPRELPAERLADIDEVAQTSALLVDARDPSRFRGEGDLVDPRTGHIPGAESLPCRDNLDAEGRFLPAGSLLERFSALGIDGDTDVISYCGSGVTACHNLIAFELAGLGNKRLYPGSWSQWSSDPERPIETGPPAAGRAVT
jgi:thiosulfate/3-mercaptopyruvate sulfurtransferase